MGESMITREYPHGDIEREGAANVAEFREKYAKKRFSSKTAPKSILLSFLYDCYQLHEGGITGAIYPDMESIKRQVKTYEDMNAWNGYLGLVEWQRSAFNTAVFMRNALNSALSDLNNVVKSIIAGENLRREAGEDRSATFDLWLGTLTLEQYQPQADGHFIITTLRTNIEAALLYMSAYNTFMDILAEFTKTPEYTILKVHMKEPLDSLASVNEALSALRDDAKQYREPEIIAAEQAGDTNLWPVEYYRETMKVFEPVGESLPPMPEEKKKEARDKIKRRFGGMYMSWYSVFTDYASEYWRRSNER